MKEEELMQYARILKKYINSDITLYTMGLKKRPKEKQLKAQAVQEKREDLQEKLKIGWNWQYRGKWKLVMVGANETPGSKYCDSGYWDIFPLNSDNQKYLNYLANEALPKVFRGKEFYVESTMIPCNGNIGWDTK